MANTNPRYLGNRRGACDRCRGQKLRCSREGQNGPLNSAKCARCAKADALCIFSTSMKAGRPSTATAKASTKNRKGSTAATNVVAWDALATEENEDFAMDDASPNDLFDHSLQKDVFRMPTAEGLVEGANGKKRRAPAIDTSPLPSTFEAFSASDGSSLFSGDPLDFSNPLEEYNIPSSALDGSLSFLNATYPIDFGPLTQDYSRASHQVPELNFQPQPGSFAGDASHGSDGTLLDEGTSPAKAHLETRLGESAHVTKKQSRPLSHAKSPGFGQNSTSVTKSADDMDSDMSIDHSYMASKSNDPEPCPPAASQDIRHRRMQELSDLGMTFYTQVLETTSSSTSTASPQSSPQLPFALASKVLSSSTRFLDLLTTLYSTIPCSASSPTTTHAAPDRRSPSNSVDDDIISHRSPSPLSSGDGHGLASSFPEAKEIQSSSYPGARQSGYWYSQSSLTRDQPLKPSRSPPRLAQTRSSQETKEHVKALGNSGTEGDQPADMTEVFALLTCYIRLLHLHSLLYARITEIVTFFAAENSSPSTSDHPGAPAATYGSSSRHSTTANLSTLAATISTAAPAPLFPGLCLDGVCLDNFAKFQIKFLLQITTHTLGEIEGVLGLPEGYRVSRRESAFGANSSGGGVGGGNASGKKERSGRRIGIFETGCVSRGFIEMTLKERGLNMESTATGTGTGKSIGVGDRLMSIRDHLAELRKLLRGTINP
ncbi:MAG: hypothetical protein LQ352_007510 [Teloschistes flavicans]|nr:MAG: hypothetical protein LQ352_007510 [Teloschistes flavicans]